MADDTSEVLARSNSYLKFLQQLLCSISFKQILIFNQNRSPLLNGIFTNTAEIRDLRYSDKLQSKVSKRGVLCKVINAVGTLGLSGYCTAKNVNIGSDFFKL